MNDFQNQLSQAKIVTTDKGYWSVRVSVGLGRRLTRDKEVSMCQVSLSAG